MNAPTMGLGWIEERTATEIVESIKEKYPSMSEQQIDFVSRTLKDKVRVPPKDAQSDEPNADSQVRAIGVTGEELLEQFREQGGLDKLEAAILLLRHSLELCATKNPTRPIVLSALATALVAKYEQLANHSVLEEAISLHRKALELCPHGHTRRFKLLNHLADALLTQYEHYGNSSVWEEVVRLLREALKLLPPGHPKRGPLLNSLSKALLTHYQMTSSKDANLLEEAIRLYNDALELFSREHPNHELLSANLAYALLKQSEHLGNINTVEEQTGLFRKILEYFPHGHPERGTALNNLALILQNRHERTGDAQTLVEATGLFHEALELRPHAHPHHDKVLMNLVKCYWNHFFHDHDEIHLVNALELCKEALNTRPIGHPSRCYTHQAIAFMYLVKTSFFDWSAGLSHLKEAAEDNHASPRYRLEKFRLPLRQLERISTCNIDEYFYSQPALDVYTAVIQLLPSVAHLGLDPSNRLQELSGSENMSRAAAMRAMLLDQIPLAVEIYEEGKAVFWLQALRLRSTELNSLPPSDRDELLRLFRLLEQESPIFTGDVTDEAKMESWTSYRRQLSEQSENLIGQIRLRPGFERFLRIPRFDELVEAANSGFVVLLVANEPIFFAIIIHPLGLLKPILLESVTGSMLQRLHTRLSGFGMRDFTCNMDSMSNDINRGMRAKLPDQGNPLEQMWQAIVGPVISGIGSKVSKNG
jgi:tetratricopeptide (TPR) repeat protein